MNCTSIKSSGTPDGSEQASARHHANMSQAAPTTGSCSTRVAPGIDVEACQHAGYFHPTTPSPGQGEGRKGSRAPKTATSDSATRTAQTKKGVPEPSVSRPMKGALMDKNSLDSCLPEGPAFPPFGGIIILPTTQQLRFPRKKHADANVLHRRLQIFEGG